MERWDETEGSSHGEKEQNDEAALEERHHRALLSDEEINGASRNINEEMAGEFAAGVPVPVSYVPRSEKQKRRRGYGEGKRGRHRAGLGRFGVCDRLMVFMARANGGSRSSAWLCRVPTRGEGTWIMGSHNWPHCLCARCCHYSIVPRDNLTLKKSLRPSAYTAVPEAFCDYSIANSRCLSTS